MGERFRAAGRPSVAAHFRRPETTPSHRDLHTDRFTYSTERAEAINTAFLYCIATGAAPTMPFIFEAAKSGDEAAVKQALSAGESVHLTDEGGWKPLHLAVRAVGLPAPICNCLSLAIGNRIVCRYSERQNFSLFWQGHKNVTKLLIDAGADPRSPSNGGWTALHCAGASPSSATASKLAWVRLTWCHAVSHAPRVPLLSAGGSHRGG